MRPTIAATTPPPTATTTGTQRRLAHPGTRTTAATITRPTVTGTTTCQRCSMLTGLGATRPTTATAKSETPASRSSTRPTGDSMAPDATPPWWAPDQTSVQAFGMLSRSARLTAETMALIEAVTIEGSTPTPQRTRSPTAHSTYAAARASPPADRACSA